MKKLVILLALIYCGLAYSQVHKSRIPETVLTDSVLGTGKHEFTIKTDSSIRMDGYVNFLYPINPTNWTKNQSSVNAYQYEKTKIVAGKLPSSVPNTFTVAHGITDWHTIKSYTCRIMEDSSNVWVTPGLFSDPGSANGRYVNSVWVDSLNCSLRLSAGANAVNLVNDSVFYYLIYTDFNK